MKGNPKQPQFAVESGGSWLFGGNRQRTRAAPDDDERPSRRRRRHKSGLYDQMIDALGVLLVLGLCAGMWYSGAFFTVRWLAGVGITQASYGAFVWSLPVALTLLELALMPFFRHQDGLRTLIWLGVVSFDVYTTVTGALPWLRSLALPFLTTPQTDYTLLAAIVFGLLVALGPEPIARHVWSTR